MILCSLILLSSLYTIGMAEIYLPNNWLLIFPCFSFLLWLHKNLSLILTDSYLFFALQLSLVNAALLTSMFIVVS